MKLLSLSIRNFRGFGTGVDSINLDGSLILIYGPNGYGKTSFTEALEWLFYGSTKRRQRGELYSKTEYAGSFANAHGGEPIEVTLRVSWHGREHVLSRRLLSPDTSVTSIDGVDASFSTIGLTPVEAWYPVVAQHGLQTFIHTRPKDRRDAICEALGLESLTDMKATLESARLSFQRTPPLRVVEARRSLALLAPTLATIPQAAQMAQRWLKTPLQADLARDLPALLAAAAALTGSSIADEETSLTKLREARKIASQAVFDTASIAMPTDEPAVRQAVRTAADAVFEAGDAVEAALARVSASTAAQYAGAWLAFWKEGLELASADKDCPMCGEPTLTDQRKAKLRDRLAAGIDLLTDITALRTRAKAWSTASGEMESAVRALGPLMLDEVKGYVKLKAVLADHEGELQRFMEAHDQLQDARAIFASHLTATGRLIEEAPDRAASPTELPNLLKAMQGAFEYLGTKAAFFEESLSTYNNSWLEIEPVLANKVDASNSVSLIDACGKALRALPSISTLTRFDRVLSETQTLIRAVETEVQTKQAALLKTRGAEVKSLYMLLNQGSSVGFDTMEPGNDSMKLHATSFGVRMSAAANLSECQLNCLGLSMWLMRATTTGSPFGFILLDDPVQSMDDDHAEAFIAEVVPHLLDNVKKQVIVLSHVKKVTDRLKDLNPTRTIRHYHYESYTQDGPVIVEQARRQKLIAEIKQAAAGNENNRLHAVDRLRVLIEIVIRDIYRLKTGGPTPPNYDHALPRDLLRLFQLTPGTTPAEHAGMKDTIGFCDPAHHDEVGWSPPLQSHIRPHIDRIETLIKTYGVA